MWTSLTLAAATEDTTRAAAVLTAIPWSQIGAKAGADYKGEGLAVAATESGARLRCVFQRLEGQATPEGLWRTSTITTTTDRFRVVVTEVGRVTPCAPMLLGNSRDQETANDRHAVMRPTRRLPANGSVEVAEKLVRFIRPGVIEEYSVSMDGLRQDFIIERRPAGAGELRVELDVTGIPPCGIKSAAFGAQLVLPKSGRKIAYSRLRATDATGRELPARMEVVRIATSAPRSAANGGDAETLGGAHGATRTTLTVLVDDTEAVYPVRIDPTFSDANWISMGGVPGALGQVNAAVVDSSGTSILAASSPLSAMSSPTTSPNGMAAVGARSVPGWGVALLFPFLHWRCRAPTCMQAAISRSRAGPMPIAPLQRACGEVVLL